jgi:DNA-binding transcriptional LysR family regulator
MQLEMFVTVVEEQSFVRAAARVFRTQPAVSLGIRRLEDEIGNALFARTHRRDLQLTEAGEVLYEFASRMIGLRDEALTTLRQAEAACAGRIRVGVADEVGPEQFAYLIKNFQREHPKVRIEMVCDRADELLCGLRERKVDFVILASEPGGAGASFVVAPLLDCGQKQTVWTVQRRSGRSYYTCEFGRILLAYANGGGKSLHSSGSKRARKYGRVRRLPGTGCKTALSS